MDKINHIPWREVVTTTSTNDEVRQWCEQSDVSCIVSAVRQTAGRGRRGRRWLGKEGDLFFSMAVNEIGDDIGAVVLLSGLAVARVINNFCDENDVKIKWPNDVLVAGKKISGILLERSANDFWIIGIGINIVSAPEMSEIGYQATSIGGKTDRIEVLKMVVDELQILLSDYRKRGFGFIRKSWLDKAYNLGKNIMVKQGNNVIEGQFKTIADDGSLVLEMGDRIVKVIVGDVLA